MIEIIIDLSNSDKIYIFCYRLAEWNRLRDGSNVARSSQAGFTTSPQLSHTAGKKKKQTFDFSLIGIEMNCQSN